MCPRFAGEKNAPSASQVLRAVVERAGRDPSAALSRRASSWDPDALAYDVPDVMVDGA